MSAYDDSVEGLVSLIGASRQLVVLTGAGCSTESGIPAYRDTNGQWQHRRPIQFQDFTRSHAMRQRYWARSLVGWQRVSTARPNPAHIALARLQNAGHVRRLITQNIDGLHQLAGSRNVIDLHGRLADVVCLACGWRQSRTSMQAELLSLNPDWHDFGISSNAERPDGDADLETDFGSFRIPHCARCSGILKPHVVFFGESVPAQRVADAYSAVAQADGLLVAGSSLMVLSGLRFVRAAKERGIPMALLNLGRTRADDLFSHRINRPCGEILAQITAQLLSDNGALREDCPPPQPSPRRGEGA